jgi:MtN3 and saliva related transmembrane protein
VGSLIQTTLASLFVDSIARSGWDDLVPHDAKSLLIPSLQRSEIAGIVAGFGTTFAALPDFLRMLKRKSSVGMNPRMSTIMLVFQIAWVYYGLLIVSRPVVLWNVIGVLMNSLTVGAYYYFARNEHKSQVRA